MVAEAGLEAASQILLCSKMCVYAPLLAEYGSFFQIIQLFAIAGFPTREKIREIFTADEDIPFRGYRKT
jgi:hypothetical protein